MSDIRITSTGRVFYQVDSTLAEILCELLPEAVQRHQKPTPMSFPTPARWTNSVTTGALKFLNVQCSTCKRSDRFDGSPDFLPVFEKSLCVHAGKCPESVRAEYGDGGYQVRK